MMRLFSCANKHDCGGHGVNVDGPISLKYGYHGFEFNFFIYSILQY